MRTAALPNFRKLWGRIETDIPAGAAVRISIRNRYNSYRFGGKKKVCHKIVSTHSSVRTVNVSMSVDSHNSYTQCGSGGSQYNIVAGRAQ